MAFLVDLAKGPNFEPAPHDETDRLHVVFSDQHEHSAD